MVLPLRQLDHRRARLGMTKSAVAQRANVSLPTVRRILAGEVANPTVPNLHAIARALGIVVRLGDTIAIEEPQPAEEYRRMQALEKARRLVRMVQGTMALEGQAVDGPAVDQMIEQTMCKLLASKRRLWSE